MVEQSTLTHYPLDIELKRHPLMEAWLDIRWRLEPDAEQVLGRDPYFPFALGVFYQSVKDEFGHQEDLAASWAPEGFLPYVVRHRFRPREGEWPVLQLGPGVATVNFTESYTWSMFEARSLYLREKLLAAYAGGGLDVARVALRYRNGEFLEELSGDVLGFLEQKLNTSIHLPRFVPGSLGGNMGPGEANIALTYDLTHPVSKGTVKFATGKKKVADPETGQQIDKPILVWELWVVSSEQNAPRLEAVDEFSSWLVSAHRVIHDWFFSLVEGPLREKYENGRKET